MLFLLRKLVVVCLGVGLSAETASQLYKKAKSAESSGAVVEAYLLYSQAAALEPQNKEYWARGYALRTKAAMAAKAMPLALTAKPGQIETAPAIETTITDRDLQDLTRLRPPPELQPSKASKSFDLRGDAKSLFEQAARAYGLDVVFDSDYSAPQPIRFRLNDAPFHETIHALEAATSSFIAPVNERMFLVAKDTQQKRNEVEPTVAIAFPIPQTTSVQETQELARAVQQVMEIQKFAVDSTRRLVMIRDRVSKVRPALHVFEQMAFDRPQIAIEMEFLEVNRNSSLSYGLRLPTSFPLVNFGGLLKSVPSIPAGITKFFAFGGGGTFLGLGLTNAQLFASMSRATSSTLLSTTLRSLDGQPAEFHIGERFPIITAGYFGEIPPGEQAFSPPPSFTFEELGLVLKVTPRVHGMDEVSLQVEAEFKVLTGGAVNGIPVISTRKFNSTIRLKYGEWGVMAGLLNRTDARNLSGIAGLAGLPYLGALFRTNSSSDAEGETMILLKPTLLNLPTSEIVTRALLTGSETRPVTPF